MVSIDREIEAFRKKQAIAMKAQLMNCSCCNGSGRYFDAGQYWDCQACNGSGVEECGNDYDDYPQRKQHIQQLINCYPNMTEEEANGLLDKAVEVVKAMYQKSIELSHE